MKKYENYVSNLSVLCKAELEDMENEFIISGIIDKFFVQFELGWKVLKELLKYEGVEAAVTGSPRVIIKEAYKVFPFLNEDIWLSMLRARNDMTHIYNGTAARRLVQVILDSFIPEFMRIQKGIEEYYEGNIPQV